MGTIQRWMSLVALTTGAGPAATVAGLSISCENTQLLPDSALIEQIVASPHEHFF